MARKKRFSVEEEAKKIGLKTFVIQEGKSPFETKIYKSYSKRYKR